MTELTAQGVDHLGVIASGQRYTTVPERIPRPDDLLRERAAPGAEQVVDVGPARRAIAMLSATSKRVVRSR